MKPALVVLATLAIVANVHATMPMPTSRLFREPVAVPSDCPAPVPFGYNNDPGYARERFVRMGYFPQALLQDETLKAARFLTRDERERLTAGDNAVWLNNGRIAVWRDGHYGILDRDGREITPPRYDEIVFFAGLVADAPIPVRVGDRWGYIDADGAEIIPPQFEGVDLFFGGLAHFRRGWYYGYIDHRGEEVFPSAEVITRRQHQMESLTENTADDLWPQKETVIQDGKVQAIYGYVDVTGNWIIPAQYTDAENFRNGQATVGQGDKYGIINREGKEIVPIAYDRYIMKPVDDGVPVKCGGKYGFVNTEGKETIPPQYDDIYKPSEGIMVVARNEKYGYVDLQGKAITPLQYDNARSFREGRAAVVRNGKYGYIDTQGKEVIPPQYEDAWWFRERLAVVRCDGKYGYIDLQGNEVIPPQYEYAESFFSSRAKFSRNGKFGHIDPQGREATPPQYDEVGFFNNGKTYVKRDGKYGHIDLQGNEIVPLQYENLPLPVEGRAMFKRDNKYGYLNEQLQEIIPPLYKSADYRFKNGRAKVSLNDETTFIDRDGNIIGTTLLMDAIPDARLVSRDYGNSGMVFLGARQYLHQRARVLPEMDRGVAAAALDIGEGQKQPVLIDSEGCPLARNLGESERWL